MKTAIALSLLSLWALSALGCAPVAYRTDPARLDDTAGTKEIIEGIRELDGKSVRLRRDLLTPDPATPGRATGERVHRAVIAGLFTLTIGIATGAVGAVVGTIGARNACERGGYFCGFGEMIGGFTLGMIGTASTISGAAMAVGFSRRPDAEVPVRSR